MAELEDVHHRAGWDNTGAVLYPVCRDGQVVDGVIAYSTQQVHLDQLPGSTPRESLHLLATLLSQPGHQPSLARCYSSAPVAHILIHEAWMYSSAIEVDDVTGLEEEIAGRRLADVPGSVEIRLAVAVLGRHRLVVRRVRGEEPMLLHADKNSPVGIEFAGLLMEALIAVDRAAKRAYLAAKPMTN
ncbi:MAG: hypothetical protein GEU83_12170 [Pseudonocardiaceae bacterium]|nr:hypothetical protein [Pseudonocardiaceae bacterium]